MNLAILFCLFLLATRRVNSSRPSLVNIGALFTLNSTIGKVARHAIDLAVSDVNADPTILVGTTLNVILRDTSCNNFMGILESLELMENDVLAVIGPQSSSTSHVISNVVNELHVPLLSFSSTDPALTSSEYPYFLRTTQSDYFQMNAVADIVQYYGWREVTAIYVDNDYGRGAITALGDALAKKRSKISYKAGYPASASLNDINNLLVKVNLMESRVFVVHAGPDSGLNVFSLANDLGMLSPGYVWIATDWLATVVDSLRSDDDNIMSLIQGAIVLRHHTADSEEKRSFVSRWNEMIRKGNQSVKLNSYGLYAYDSVWLVARAVDRFLAAGRNISFSRDPRLSHASKSILQMAEKLTVFDEGRDLLQYLLLSNYTGLTGRLQFDSDRNLINPSFDVLNIAGTGFRTIGYWSNYSGLSTVVPGPPYQRSQNTSSSGDNKMLYTAIWPGQTTEHPRGWVFPNNGNELRIGVPNRASFKQFISASSDSDGLSGFCIDVFLAALKLLPYPVPYRFILIGDGSKNPNYDHMFTMIARNEVDAVVGDTAIVRNRTKLADFTQPYAESGLVIVAPVHERSSNAWAFLKPFTRDMWIVTGAFFLFVGAVVWILEHRNNSEFQGSPKQQIVTVCWFTFSTMFFSHREKTVSTLGRFVLLIWLFVVLIITSSYTANLTSILTVQQLESGIKGIESLQRSSDPIGYQDGKFVKNYLIEELNIAESRLVPLNTAEEFARALELGPNDGGVAAIVDELPYIEVFLSVYCNFKIVGSEFTRNGWGFAFHRDSPLAIDMSTAILTLSETGDLQRIHDKWLTLKACASQQTALDSNRLGLSSFWGLFLIIGIICIISLVVYVIKMCYQYRKYTGTEVRNNEGSELSNQSNSGQSNGRNSLTDMITFIGKKEDEVNKVMRTKEGSKPQESGQFSDSILPA